MKPFFLKPILSKINTITVAGTLLTASFPTWSTSLTGLEIMHNVNARPDGNQITRQFTITTTDRRGVERVEKTMGYRKYFGDEKRTVIFYTEPTNVRGTGFLTYDYPNLEKDDDQWLYLPALRKVRRISASNRGDSFLGTDLSYEEIKKENKVEIEDYTFEFIDDCESQGKQGLLVKATPKNDEIKAELGYSRVEYCIDPDIWMARHIEFWDTNNNHLKTLNVLSVEQIDGIWTTRDIHVVNHKTKHETRFTQADIDYNTDIADNVFTQPYLRRGLR
ncbi:outer membrane lipoprotein-sorting protein [Aurantivibrio plasticivorans]